jgi:hypothetical protein
LHKKEGHNHWDYRKDRTGHDHPVEDHVLAQEQGQAGRKGVHGIVAADDKRPQQVVPVVHEMEQAERHQRRAIGAMREALCRGLRIPDDIAVVGFDDIEEGRYSFPSLTTISPDKQGIARKAVEQLFARLRDPTLPSGSHLAGHSLIVRESSEGPGSLACP